MTSVSRRVRSAPCKCAQLFGPAASIGLATEEPDALAARRFAADSRLLDEDNSARWAGSAGHERGRGCRSVRRPVRERLSLLHVHLRDGIHVQPFGVPLGFGGPYCGVIATREKFVRQMPGRLAGQTTDRNGKRGFVLTLATREHHIRRDNATSTICTNEGLIALAATVYMVTMGRKGIQEVVHQQTDVVARRMASPPGV